MNSPDGGPPAQTEAIQNLRLGISNVGGVISEDCGGGAGGERVGVRLGKVGVVTASGRVGMRGKAAGVEENGLGVSRDAAPDHVSGLLIPGARAAESKVPPHALTDGADGGAALRI